MLEEESMLEEEIEKYLPEKSTVDPSIFDDPIAMMTEWTSVNRSRGDYQPHKLAKESPYRLTFRTTSGQKILAVVGFIIGLILFAIGSLAAYFGEKNSIWWVLTGLFLSVNGLYGRFVGGATLIFDKVEGLYWKNYSKSRTSMKLQDIHALQLIAERSVYHLRSKYRCKDRSSPPWVEYRYELNLVMKDDSRINITDHREYSKVKEHAQKVSEFLNVPVWDAIETDSPEDPASTET